MIFVSMFVESGLGPENIVTSGAVVGNTINMEALHKTGHVVLCLAVNGLVFSFATNCAGKKHCQVEVHKEYFWTSFSNHRKIS